MRLKSSLIQPFQLLIRPHLTYQKWFNLRFSIFLLTFSLSMSHLHVGDLSIKMGSAEPTFSSSYKVPDWVLKEGTTSTSGARSTLLINSTLMGLGVYGPTLLFEPSISTNNEPSKLNVAGFFLTVGGSYVIPSLLYEEDEVTWAMTDFAHSAFARGIYHGVLMNSLIDGSIENSFRLASLFSITEGSLALYFSRKYQMNAGKTHTFTTVHDLSNLAVLSVLPSLANYTSVEAVQSILLGTSGLSLLGGYFYTQMRPFHTWGDAEVLRLSGALGVVSMLPLMVNFDINNEHIISALFLGGLIGGTVLGDLFLKEIDFSPSEALITDVVTVSGLILGVALGYLVLPTDMENMEDIGLWGGTLGAIAGYGIRIYQQGKKSLHSSSDLRQKSIEEPAIKTQISPWFTPSQVKLGEVNRGVAFTVNF